MEETKLSGNERNPEDLKRTDIELLENDLYHSEEFLSLIRKIKLSNSFDEVNQLIELFNVGNDIKTIGAKFKKMEPPVGEQGIPFYIEKADRKSIQKIMVFVRFSDGKIRAINCMKEDGTIKSMLEEVS